MSAARLLAALNPPQRLAVRHVEGPLLVLAGPGSGKTRVVTHRIAFLLEQGIPARQVLAVTFTNKAAREMRDRVRKLVGKRAKDLTVATFHSACARILRQEIDALGYGKNFSIYDEASQESLVRHILRDLKGIEGAPSPAALLGEMNAPAPPPTLGADGTPVAADPDEPADARAALIASARERYRAELRARNAVDFDELISLTVRLFRECPEALERWRDRYRYLLVDEYQDTNAAQEEVLTLLAGPRRNLCVVGDDDQSIYGWRGAEVEHILRFTERYPGAALVKLEQNYRSTKAIVGVAAAAIGKNLKRHAKDLFTAREAGTAVRLVECEDDEAEAEFIAGEVRDVVEAAKGDPWVQSARFAVLFRTNEQTRPIEQALRKYKVPYRLLGGRSFFERKEVMDVLAYLRLAHNRRDEEALWRVVNVPSRGLGARAIDALRRAVPAGGEAWDVLAGIARGTAAPEGVAPGAQSAVLAFVAAIEDLAQAGEKRSPSLVSDFLKAIDYQQEIDRTYKDANVRLARMALAQEMQQAWAAHLAESAKDGLAGFLEGLALNARDDDGSSGGGVTLATIHASKGLEFEAVYVAGLEEGTFPHRRSVEDGRSLEEERRLFYVALTRAMDGLTLTRAAKRTVRGKESRTVPSRFLAEVPRELLHPHDASLPRSTPAVAGHLERLRASIGAAKAR